MTGEALGVISECRAAFLAPLGARDDDDDDDDNWAALLCRRAAHKRIGASSGGELRQGGITRPLRRAAPDSTWAPVFWRALESAEALELSRAEPQAANKLALLALVRLSLADKSNGTQLAPLRGWLLSDEPRAREADWRITSLVKLRQHHLTGAGRQWTFHRTGGSDCCPERAQLARLALPECAAAGSA